MSSFNVSVGQDCAGCRCSGCDFGECVLLNFDFEGDGWVVL